jgi:hypothetical protein
MDGIKPDNGRRPAPYPPRPRARSAIRALIIIPASGPTLSVEAASSRLKRQDGASTTQRTDAALAGIMIDAGDSSCLIPVKRRARWALIITPTTGARGLRSQAILAWICQGWKP